MDSYDVFFDDFFKTRTLKTLFSLKRKLNFEKWMVDIYTLDNIHLQLGLCPIFFSVLSPHLSYIFPRSDWECLSSFTPFSPPPPLYNEEWPARNFGFRLGRQTLSTIATHSHVHTAFRHSSTVPYEGGNFANSKMDHFSLIFKTS